MKKNSILHQELLMETGRTCIKLGKNNLQFTFISCDISSLITLMKDIFIYVWQLVIVLAIQWKENKGFNLSVVVRYSCIIVARFYLNNRAKMYYTILIIKMFSVIYDYKLIYRDIYYTWLNDGIWIRDQITLVSSFKLVFFSWNWCY